VRAYIVETGHAIFPFGDRVADLPVGNERVADAQARVCQRLAAAPERVADLEAVDSTGECLLTYDDVYFTVRVLKDFLRRARAGKRSVALALPRSLFTDLTLPGTGLEYEPGGDDGEIVAYRLYYLAEPGPWDAERLAALPRLVPTFKEKVVNGATPSRLVTEQYAYPVTSSVVFHLRNWFHLYRANLQALTVRWVEQITGKPLWTALRLLAALPGMLRSPPLWAVARRLNVRGKRCRIHPRAIVEFSLLGDDVTIGAGAIVRGCLLGAGTNISDGSHLQYSVLGERCFTSKSTILNGVVAFAESDVCPAMQLSLVGNQCSLTARSHILDINLQGSVRIWDGAQVVDTGTAYLGACFGHRVRTGFDVAIAHGRAIPNDTILVSDDDSVLRKIPGPLPPGVPLIVTGGVPVEKT